MSDGTDGTELHRVPGFYGASLREHTGTDHGCGSR